MWKVKEVVKEDQGKSAKQTFGLVNPASLHLAALRGRHRDVELSAFGHPGDRSSSRCFPGCHCGVARDGAGLCFDPTGWNLLDQQHIYTILYCTHGSPSSEVL